MSELRSGSDIVSAARMEGDILVIQIRGEVDLHNSTELRTELLDLLNKQSPARLVLNLSKVPYMDSSAIAVLVEALQKIRRSGGRNFLTDPQPRGKGGLGNAPPGSIFVVGQKEAEGMGKQRKRREEAGGRRGKILFLR